MATGLVYESAIMSDAESVEKKVLWSVVMLVDEEAEMTVVEMVA